MQVSVIAATQFIPENIPDRIPWRPQAHSPNDGDQLAEFAGRACYESWNRPNPLTATNVGYLAHILEVGHGSVLEHGTISFYIEGVSRSLTHELVRHRHFSYSQLSQRYVNGEDSEMVPPPEFADNPGFMGAFDRAVYEARESYVSLVEIAEAVLSNVEGISSTERRKRARQAARAVLPNATETRIVVTANYRALRHFFRVRAAAPADVEIRALAVEMFRQTVQYAPSAFQDFTIVKLPDGTEALESPVGSV